MRQKRKVVMAIVPARKREPRVFRPYVVSSCRSRQAASVSNKLARSALEKGGGASERGPRRRGVWHVSVRGPVDRNDGWCVGQHPSNGCWTGLDPERRENVVQRSSRPSKAGEAVAGPGL